MSSSSSASTAESWHTFSLQSSASSVTLDSAPSTPAKYLITHSTNSDLTLLLSHLPSPPHLNVTSAKCTHYGAPLEKTGVLSPDGRLTCGWHGACFNVRSGDIEDFPALDKLKSFPVKFEEGELKVFGTEDAFKGDRVSPDDSLASCDKKRQRKSVVVVGGGVGAQGLIETLAGKGFQIDVYSSESYTPIDRTKLSKALITDASKVALRPKDFYSSRSVNMHLSTEVSSVSTEKKTISLSSGEEVPYEILVLAPGGKPNDLPLPGFDMQGVFKIRTIDRNQELMAAVKDDSKIVVVGASFIGIEVANALMEKNRSVTVVDTSKKPMAKVLGEEVGDVVQRLLEEKGVKFVLEAELEKAIESKTQSGSVAGVQLKSGQVINADFVILGVGVKPNTAFLKNSGINLEKDGSLLVDQYMSVKGQKDIYAIGDVARFPYGGDGGPVIRVEHYNVALNHGRTAAQAISGNHKPFTNTPVFWSACGQQLRYSGHTPDGFDECFVQGEPKEAKFIAYYIKKNSIVAVASMQMDPAVSHAAELFRTGGMPSVDDVKKGLDIRDVPIESGSTIKAKV